MNYIFPLIYTYFNLGPKQLLEVPKVLNIKGGTLNYSPCHSLIALRDVRLTHIYLNFK